MTLDEKLKLLHGHGWQFLSNEPGGADGTEPIPRLGIPALRMADSSAFEYGALIGRELRDEGYNLSQGGGVNLAREPRDGIEVAQVYASLPASASEPPKRLVGWARVPLAAGESKPVSLAINRYRFTIFDERSNGWQLVPGGYKILVGPSWRDLPLSTEVTLR